MVLYTVAIKLRGNTIVQKVIFEGIRKKRKIANKKVVIAL